MEKKQKKRKTKAETADHKMSFRFLFKLHLESKIIDFGIVFMKRTTFLFIQQSPRISLFDNEQLDIVA